MPHEELIPLASLLCVRRTNLCHQEVVEIFRFLQVPFHELSYLLQTVSGRLYKYRCIESTRTSSAKKRALLRDYQCCRFFLCYMGCCSLWVLLCFLLVLKAIEKLAQKITGKRRFLMLMYEVSIVLAASPQDFPCQCISVLNFQWHQPPIQGIGRGIQILPDAQ